jgi:hypothetical protein
LKKNSVALLVAPVMLTGNVACEQFPVEQKSSSFIDDLFLQWADEHVGEGVRRTCTKNRGEYEMYCTVSGGRMRDPIVVYCNQEYCLPVTIVREMSPSINLINR